MRSQNFYSITSSARSRIEVGIVMPSVLALSAPSGVFGAIKQDKPVRCLELLAYAHVKNWPQVDYFDSVSYRALCRPGTAAIPPGLDAVEDAETLDSKGSATVADVADSRHTGTVTGS
jgi:hypothetical protein